MKRKFMNSKSDLGMVVMKGMEMAQICFYISSTADTTALYPIFPYDYLLMHTMCHFSWWRHFFFGRDCGIPSV